MKLAAVKALADLAKQDVPDSVRKAYAGEDIQFGRNYIIPKPFDPRVLLHVAPAVAQAAMDTGVARRPIKDMQKYRESLEAMQGRSKEVMRTLINKAKAAPKRIVFPEGEEDKILRAAQILVSENIATPILLGNAEAIAAKAKNLHIDLSGITIIDPTTSDKRDEYVNKMFELRQRKGVTHNGALSQLKGNYNYFGALMVQQGDADTMLSGINHHYPETIRPSLEIIGKQNNLSKVHGMYMMVFKKQVVFIADATVAIDPTPEELAETAILVAEKVRQFDIVPKVAMLSFSNFGSSTEPQALKVKKPQHWSSNLILT
jgi:malate dehydrogenase (oxaloacetate-decarboxylating)(NADP+)